ncbi:hypothetical protein [Pseudarthrobacter sp. NamB4]|uniref:hypothetical protein n=1 Tax=Pseudarthrobacter sp. NamB4 TaxID=2576837 RepID=UPI0010FD3A63|nr:hypothetical protein [Pseudarthrobacter sp. NamB4]TLM70927.1 hypothetical protein FDW81_16860 [Pseudarthrobacter sp. NamB4]
MADETAEEAISRVAAEYEENYGANRERFAAEFWYEVDPRLMRLLAPMTRIGDDTTVELTVVVGGTTISGSVVSARAWAQRQNDQVRIGSPAIAEVFDTLDAQAVEPGPLPVSQNRYIHFLEPVLLSGGTRVRVPATRVDLGKVAAWSIGRIPGE